MAASTTDELVELLRKERELVGALRTELKSNGRHRGQDRLLQLGAIIISAIMSAAGATWFVSSTFATKSELTQVRGEIQTSAPFARRETEIDARFVTIGRRLSAHEDELREILRVVTANETNIRTLLSHQERGRE